MAVDAVRKVQARHAAHAPEQELRRLAVLHRLDEVFAVAQVARDRAAQGSLVGDAVGDRVAVAVEQQRELQPEVVDHVVEQAVHRLHRRFAQLRFAQPLALGLADRRRVGQARCGKELEHRRAVRQVLRQGSELAEGELEGVLHARQPHRRGGPGLLAVLAHAIAGEPPAAGRDQCSPDAGDEPQQANALAAVPHSGEPRVHGSDPLGRFHLRRRARIVVPESRRRGLVI